METLKKAISQIVSDNPELKEQVELLDTITGVGITSAANFLAETGDINYFENASQLAAFVGLNPKGFRSGSSVRKKTRISKEGRAFLRKILFMPALVASRYNPIVAHFVSVFLKMVYRRKLLSAQLRGNFCILFMVCSNTRGHLTPITWRNVHLPLDI